MFKIPIEEASKISKSWSALKFTKLLSIQDYPLQIEFVIDLQTFPAQVFFETLKAVTLKKHPAGTLSWLGHWGAKDQAVNTQYRKYRIEYQDSQNKDPFDENKAKLFLSNLTELLTRWEKEIEQTGIQRNSEEKY